MGIDHSQDLKFESCSERLIFRALEENDDDKKFVFAINNDPLVQVMSSMALFKPSNMAAFDKFVEFGKKALLVAIACLPPFVKDENGDDTEVRVAPADVKTDESRRATTPIGFVVIMSRGDALAHHRCGQLGISILAPFTGKGYGGEMINWVLDWSFRKANLHRVELGTWSVNHNAIKLYRSIGFVQEGREREAFVLDRKWVDVLKFSMLEGEWEKLRGISS